MYHCIYKNVALFINMRTHIIKLLMVAAGFALLSLQTTAQTTDDRAYILGGATNDQLRIEVMNGGRYLIRRYDIGAGGWMRQFYFESSTNIFALRIGGITYTSDNDPLYANDFFTSTTDLAAVTAGVQQHVIKKFSGDYLGYPFSVTITIRYNTSNPAVMTMQAAVDAVNIPAGTPIALAYGFDAYVNGCDRGVALLVPDILGLNNQDVGSCVDLTHEQVRSLRMVGGINSRGLGSLIGFFAMGRPFDKVRSEYYINTRAISMLASSFNRVHFGPNNVTNCAGGYSTCDQLSMDNGVGVAWENIPAGVVTNIPVGLSFTTNLDGELDYTWNGSKNLLAGVNDRVTLDLQYASWNEQALSNIGFSVDLPGLVIDSACTQTNFTDGIFDCTQGDSHYVLSGAAIGALDTARIRVPIRITRCGQWQVDANSISDMKRVLPLGTPAMLTVHSSVDFVPGQETQQICGPGALTYTMRLPEGITSANDFIVDLSYSGNTEAFNAPLSVIFPADTNSITFTVEALNITAPAALTITMAGTDREYINVGNTTLNIQAYPAYAGVAAGDTICANALPYIWEGETFTSAGAITKTLATVNGCDSTVTFTLAVNPAYAVQDGAAICDNALPYIWEGETFTATGSITKTLATVNGCDSTVTFTLTVNPAYSGIVDSAAVCDNMLPYIWEGETFTSAGTITKTLTTAHGCDSTVTFTLKVYPAYANITDGDVICASQLPYIWEGETFTSAGAITKTLATVNGCDSVVTFTLRVNPTYVAEFHQEICVDALPYVWAGMVFTEAGEKTIAMQTQFGCDSLERYLLTVHALPAVAINGTPVICGDTPNTYTATGAVSYTWNTGATGNEIHTATPGVYTVAGVDEHQCVNTASIAARHVAKPFVSTVDTAVCYASEVTLRAQAWEGDLQWHSPTHFSATATGAYMVTATNECGVDTGRLTLTVWDKVQLLTPQLPPFRNKKYYEEKLVHHNAYAPVRFTYTGALPNGLSFSSQGVFSGKPEVAGDNYDSYRLRVRLEDGHSCVVSADYELERVFWAPNLIISSSATNSEFLPGMDVEIYNRQGQLIHRGKGWNGLRDGKSPVGPGTYFYKTRYLKNNVPAEASGYITVQHK